MSRGPDKSEFFASERQEPYTAAEQAQAAGLEAEYARDVPRTCICIHLWNARQRRYEMIQPLTECPWHTEGSGDGGSEPAV